MSSKDNRPKRCRNTLTVDLGLYGLPLLDACLGGLASWRRENGMTKGRHVKRSEVIRDALRVLKVALEESPGLILKALNRKGGGERE